ncbi:transcriptional regulator [Paraburkholderia sediminicola]|uniref:hypothetical protein n=1 Tax=Paraburkholderia sediminicola TaxID=458836 RepID=UPI0038BAAF0D
MTRQAKQIPEAVKAFNDLPDDARVPAEVVTALFSISNRTLARRIREGVIPAPATPNPRTFNVGRLRKSLRSLP